MKIHISQTTYEHLKAANQYRLTPRGEIPIKGKGTMTTYWLDGKDSNSPTSGRISQQPPGVPDEGTLQNLNTDMEQIL